VVNGLYFQTQVGAEKSVKYNPAAHVNRGRSLYRLAGASALHKSTFEINVLYRLTFGKALFPKIAAQEKRAQLSDGCDSENWSKSFNPTQTEGS
jgi:hypothetical protein